MWRQIGNFSRFLLSRGEKILVRVSFGRSTPLNGLFSKFSVSGNRICDISVYKLKFVAEAQKELETTFLYTIYFYADCWKPWLMLNTFFQYYRASRSALCAVTSSTVFRAAYEPTLYLQKQYFSKVCYYSLIILCIITWKSRSFISQDNVM